MSDSDAYSSDEEFQEEPPPPPPTAPMPTSSSPPPSGPSQTPSVPFSGPAAPTIQELLAQAKQTMTNLKSDLSLVDTSNLLTPSPPPTPPPTPPNPPKSPSSPPSIPSSSRTSWLTSTRGCGVETTRPPSPNPLPAPPNAPPPPFKGLSSQVTLLRKGAPKGGSFAPPKHLDKTVPRDPPPKLPITKRGKRLLAAGPVDVTKVGPMSHWEQDKDPLAVLAQKGTSFAPPAHVDKTVPLNPPPREPITLKSKRLLAHPPPPTNTLITVTPSTQAQPSRRQPSHGFSSQPRHCAPQPFVDLPWQKKLDEIDATRGFAGDVVSAVKSTQKRVPGGVMALAPKPSAIPPPDAITPPVPAKPEAAFNTLSKYGAPSSITIAAPSNTVKKTPVYLQTQTPGPGQYIAATSTPAAPRPVTETKHRLRPAAAAVLAERKAAGTGIGPGHYAVELAENAMKHHVSTAPAFAPVREAKGAEKRKVEEKEIEAFEVELETIGDPWGDDSDDDSSCSSCSSDSSIDSSSSDDDSSSSSSFSSDTSKRRKLHPDSSSSSLASPASTTSSAYSRTRHTAAASRATHLSHLQNPTAAPAPAYGAMKKVMYGVFKAFFSSSRDIPSGWVQLSLETLPIPAKKLPALIGGTEIYHLADARVRGTEHGGGGVDEGTFDTFGVLKKWNKERAAHDDQQLEDMSMTDDSSSSSSSSYSSSSSAPSFLMQQNNKKQSLSRQRKLQLSHFNMGWILLTTTSFLAESKIKQTLNPTFGARQNAGITWKNRNAIAERRATTAQTKTVGPTHYKPNYSTVEKATTQASKSRRRCLRERGETSELSHQPGLLFLLTTLVYRVV